MTLNNKPKLTFNLKKEWFDKIKLGEKTHEYRKWCHYWNKRIIDNLFPDDTICLACGYPKKDDTAKRLLAKVTFVSVKDGLKSDLNINKRVWDIEFKLI